MKTSNSQKKTGGIKKPFTQGTPVDTETWKKALFFFGTLLMVYFVSLIVCSMTGFSQAFLRIGVNLVIIVGILLIFYNNGANYGENAVARGEIVWQRKEKQENVSDSEVRLSYHPLKGYVTALIGMIPFVILGIILAFSAERQMTSAGTLPGWTSSLLRRSDIGGALVSYTEGEPVSSVDIIRMIVRVTIMPFVSMTGSANKDLMLTVERISPILLLLPVISYGTGFLFGKNVRTRIHTQIEENRKIRKKREIKARRARRRASSAPEQLN